jgi:murein DD-endopeptidase MepM/ murein hydrolase activator NlpD
VRVAVAAALIFALAPTPAGAPGTSADERDLAPIARPVVDDGPRLVRRELVAAAGGSQRRYVRAVRDLVENRFDVDALPWNAPITVWTVEDEIIAFDVTSPAGARLFATRLATLQAGVASERWVFDDGTSLDGPTLSRPVRYHAVSSRIGRREHPLRKQVRFHAGTDYAAPIGTPVRAVADGVVTKADRNWTAGNFIVIRHDDGAETKYLHLHARARSAVPGARVRQGEVIGAVGKTGRVTGPHLHFELRTAWKAPLDPVIALWPAGEHIADEGRLRALRLRRDLLRTWLADGSRALFDPLLRAPLGLADEPLLEPDRRALLPPLAPLRGRAAHARLLPPPTRRRRRGVSTARPLFDDAAALRLVDGVDPLLVRAVELGLDFPDDPRFA